MDINLAHVANVMSIQIEGGDLKAIRLGNARSRSNSCKKHGEVGHFHRACLKFNGKAQGGNNVFTIISQTTDTLTAISPITDMVLKSILKEVRSAKVAKKNGIQKYQQAMTSVASGTATLVTAMIQQ